VAGLNSANAVDVTSPVSVGVGQPVNGMGPMPSSRVHEWNLAIEKQLNQNTVLRLTYAGRRVTNLDQLQNLNPATPNYVWYMTTGQPLPTGTYASVANRPYDQTAYTDVQILQRTGFLNSSTIAAEVQRRFSQGLAFQAFYTLTNAFRLGGSGSRDSLGSVPDVFMPGAVPTGPAKLNRFLNYSREDAIPQHRVRWNWVYDLPFGRGQRFAGSASRLLNTAIGEFEVYGTKYPILDCRSTPANATLASQARCVPGYLWYNGYISQRYIDSHTAAGVPNGVMGLPANYQSAQFPVSPWPAGGQPGDSGSTDWDTNNVSIKLNNGATVTVAENTNLNPWRNQFRMGLINWNQDASLMKYFTLTERFRLRANVDIFNVFNNQGMNVPGSTASTEGIVSLDTSYNGFRPRQIQVAMRLEW
jgi:hypothetical protein